MPVEFEYALTLLHCLADSLWQAAVNISKTINSCCFSASSIILIKTGIQYFDSLQFEDVMRVLMKLQLQVTHIPCVRSSMQCPPAQSTSRGFSPFAKPTFPKESQLYC